MPVRIAFVVTLVIFVIWLFRRLMISPKFDRYVDETSGEKMSTGQLIGDAEEAVKNIDKRNKENTREEARLRKENERIRKFSGKDEQDSE